MSTIGSSTRVNALLAGVIALALVSSAPAQLTIAPKLSPQVAGTKVASPVDSVIQLVKSGISESLIIETLQKQNKPLDLTLEDLVKLQGARVSERIISTMIDPAAAPAAPVSASSAASLPPPGPAAPNSPAQSTQKKRGFFGKIGQTVADAARKPGDESEPKGSSGALGGRPTIKNTELQRFFDNHQKPATEPATRWPRVAILMVQAPRWHLKAVDLDPSKMRGNHTFHLDDEGCWAFTAKVWDSEKQQRDIPQFFKCTDKGLQSERGLMDISFAGWSGLRGRVLLTSGEESTGFRRTDGPIPPDSPFPNSAPYLRLPSSVTGSQSNLTSFLNTYSGIVLQQLVNATGLDYQSRDRRLWINLVPELEPEGVPATNKVILGKSEPASAAPSIDSAAGGGPPNLVGNKVPPGYRETGMNCPSNPAVMAKLASRGDLCVNGKLVLPPAK